MSFLSISIYQRYWSVDFMYNSKFQIFQLLNFRWCNPWHTTQPCWKVGIYVGCFHGRKFICLKSPFKHSYISIKHHFISFVQYAWRNTFGIHCMILFFNVIPLTFNKNIVTIFKMYFLYYLICFEFCKK